MNTTVKIVNQSNNPLPAYQTEQAAGMDLCAYLNADVVLQPLQRQLIPTGLFIELSQHTEAQIRPRSGLAFKHGITVLNSPGTIDADYRGEVKVLLVNLSNEAFTIKSGERIAQMVVAKVAQANLVEVQELTDSVRAASGFGSTGK
ncbi:dUTP diphosphatase [uncultured Cytophaga sp.]|uniref:dUTP diphosphatase n=1 Tax=uncultured Cytophaga sp. TaxID=160238 RepID=UPI002610792D|nr:dUTP diphosphatase [uncultured Cytophaga sp.]